MKAQMTLLFILLLFIKTLYLYCLFLAAMAGTKSRHKETKV